MDVLLETVHNRMTWDEMPSWMILDREASDDNTRECVQKSKSTAERALARYSKLPKAQRADASDLVNGIEAVLADAEIEPEDMGVLILMFYWV